MEPNDPRTWPEELVAQRNLALAAALGRRRDGVALAALRDFRFPTADRHITPGLVGR